LNSKEYISKMLYISQWKALLKFPERDIFCIYIGKFKEYLVFETRQSSFIDEYMKNSEIDFRIMLPKAGIHGKGIFEYSSLENDDVYGTVTRFLLKPVKIILSQKRQYKRFLVFEKGIIKNQMQRLNVIIKDISYSGIGIYTMERFLSTTGTIVVAENGINLEVNRIHEYSSYNFFQYGFIFSDKSSKKSKLKEYLKGISDKYQALELEY